MFTAEASERKTLKRVPKGTSEYQAAWIMDDGEDGSQADSDEDDLSDEDMVSVWQMLKAYILGSCMADRTSLLVQSRAWAFLENAFFSLVCQYL